MIVLQLAPRCSRAAGRASAFDAFASASDSDAAGSSVRAFSSSAAMPCAVRNGSPSSRTSVSASSVSVVPPSPARAASRCDVEVGAAHRRRDQRHRARRVAEHRRDERLQIVLGVDDVAERRVVDGGHDRLRLADRLAADRARVLERDRIALLRHDAARLHEALAEPQVAELHRAPQQEVLQHAAETDQQDRRGRHALEQVVDRRDAAVGVAGRPAEAEQLARAVAIDRKAGAGDRARAERIADW